MTGYNLQPNEVVILREGGVAHGGSLSVHTNELMLTNLHLVLTEKSRSGHVKGVRIYPLQQLKVYNGRAQALLGENSKGTVVLETYFLRGQDSFAFESRPKATTLAWISKINEVVTGQKIPYPAPDAGPRKALPGTAAVADVLKGTFDVFKERFGTKPATPPPAPAQIAGKCRSCGAPLSGLQGLTVTCAYCGSAQQL